MRVVVVSFGTDEEAVPDIEADAAAEVEQQVIAALIIGTAGKGAVVIRRLETAALRTEAGEGLDLNLLSEIGRVHGVEVVEDGTEGLISAVDVVFGAPGDFALDADVVLKEI